MIVIPVQTVLLIYARRSRVNLQYPWIKFWVLGLMYYNLSDWLGIAWVAEEYPGIRALDVCAGDYLGAGMFNRASQTVWPNPDYGQFQQWLNIWFRNDTFTGNFCHILSIYSMATVEHGYFEKWLSRLNHSVLPSTLNSAKSLFFMKSV